MGDPITMTAAAVSLASTGLGAVGQLEGAAGTSAADKYKAEVAERQAQYTNLDATQVSGQMTRNLAMTLGHIDSVRAAAHDDPTSPTGVAVRDFTERVGTEEKDIKVDSIMAQAQQDESDAAYLRSASSQALLAGDIGAASSILKGIGGALSSMGGSTPDLSQPLDGSSPLGQGGIGHA